MKIDIFTHAVPRKYTDAYKKILHLNTASVDLARIANDTLAEFAAKYPDRLIAAASLPMNNIDAALEELDRAIRQI